MTTSNKRLRILAERTIRLLDVYKGQHPPLADLDTVLMPVTQAFIEAYDAHHNFASQRREQLATGRTKIEELHKLIRSWSSTVQTLVPGFTEDTLRGSTRMPDTVLSDAKRLIALLADNIDRMPSGPALLRQVTELHETATREWNSAQRILAEHAQLSNQIAVAREAFYAPFMGFRTTLGRLLGRSHRDCFQLRLDTSRKVIETPSTQDTRDAHQDGPEALPPLVVESTADHEQAA